MFLDYDCETKVKEYIWGQTSVTDGCFLCMHLVPVQASFLGGQLRVLCF